MSPEPKKSPIAIARCENEGGHVRSTPLLAGDDLQVELQRYGITAVPLTVFDWGGYRYSNARDAISAAKRLTRSA